MIRRCFRSGAIGPHGQGEALVPAPRFADAERIEPVDQGSGFALQFKREQAR